VGTKIGGDKVDPQVGETIGADPFDKKNSESAPLRGVASQQVSLRSRSHAGTEARLWFGKVCARI
jgi:hypothetical protein